MLERAVRSSIKSTSSIVLGKGDENGIGKLVHSFTKVKGLLLLLCPEESCPVVY